MKGFFRKLAEAADSVANNAFGDQQLTAAAARTPSVASKPQDAPQDPVLEHLLRNVRSAHVRAHFFKTPASAYTEQLPIRILSGTYNVNGKPPVNGLDLAPWLSLFSKAWPARTREDAGGGDGNADGPDVVAVGFQEIVPLHAGNVIVGSSTANLVAWDQALGAYLNGKEWAAAQASASVPGAASTAQTQQQRQAAAGAAALAGLEHGWSGAVPKSAAADAVADGAAGGHSGAYVQVACRQLVGTYLTVWVRRSLLPSVKGVQATAVATGFGGYLGNKGAVVVRMMVHDSLLVFVNAHLSAGEQEGDEGKRNADVAEILRRADFTLNGDTPGVMASPAAALTSLALGPGQYGSSRGVADGVNVVWMGDLNYRLSPGAVSDEDARRHLKAGNLEPLVAADQLRLEMSGGRVFQGGWQEAGPLSFPPTFKLKVGTHTYLGDPALGVTTSDPSSSAAAAKAPRHFNNFQDGAAATGCEDTAGNDDDDAASGSLEKQQRKRTPAWCDRVLFKSSQKDLVPRGYQRGELTMSDHKPVAGAFVLQARHFNRPLVQKALDEARRAVDMLRALARPKCTLEPNLVDLGPVPVQPYEERVVLVTLVNQGTVEGMFHFVPPPSGLGLGDEGPALPPWLHASPSEGAVPAGGRSTIALRVVTEGGAAGSLGELMQQQGSNTGSSDSQGTGVPLDSIVILRVEDGGDLFLSVTGSVGHTFLGRSLSNLATSAPTLVMGGNLSGDELAQLAPVAGLASRGPLVAAVKDAVARQGSGSSSVDTRLLTSVPRPIIALVKWLLQPAQDRSSSCGTSHLSDPGLFTQAASRLLPSAADSTPVIARSTSNQDSQVAAPRKVSEGGSGTGVLSSAQGVSCPDAGLWASPAAVRMLMRGPLAPLRALLESGGMALPPALPIGPAAGPGLSGAVHEDPTRVSGTDAAASSTHTTAGGTTSTTQLQQAAAAAMLMGIIHQLHTPLLPLPLAQLCLNQAVDIKAALSLLTSSLPHPELATLNLLLALLQQHVCEAGLLDTSFTLLTNSGSSAGVGEGQPSPQSAKAAAVADLWELWAQLLLAPPPAGAPSHVARNRAQLIAGLATANDRL